MRNRTRKGTRFSKDGLTAFVTLRVDRRGYEYARYWAEYHSEADPEGAAEDQLEGYLNMALLNAMHDRGWNAPPEIEALYPDTKPDNNHLDMDDGLPF